VGWAEGPTPFAFDGKSQQLKDVKKFTSCLQ